MVMSIKRRNLYAIKFIISSRRIGISIAILTRFWRFTVFQIRKHGWSECIQTKVDSLAMLGSSFEPYECRSALRRLEEFAFIASSVLYFDTLYSCNWLKCVLERFVTALFLRFNRKKKMVLYPRFMELSWT